MRSSPHRKGKRRCSRRIEADSRTGFSREEAGVYNINFVVQTYAFPAKAGPTIETQSPSKTGFSREEAGVYAINVLVNCRSPSRLKPVPLRRRLRLTAAASALHANHRP
jgi:hypothetical protein